MLDGDLRARATGVPLASGDDGLDAVGSEVVMLLAHLVDQGLDPAGRAERQHAEVLVQAHREQGRLGRVGRDAEDGPQVGNKGQRRRPGAGPGAGELLDHLQRAVVVQQVDGVQPVSAATR